MTPTGTLTTVYSFCAQTDCTDGQFPYAGLVQGTDGNFYGTTYEGGVNGYGTVFKITPGGTLTTLHSFAGHPTDGAYPYAGLVQATNGDFYGTTYAGGAHKYGTVFKITLGGTLTLLHSFAGYDGAYPRAALVQGTNGDFYGTTFYGGANVLCADGCGTIFTITSGGALTTLNSFEGFIDEGAYPAGALFQGTDGNFYGTTLMGGVAVFKITSEGRLTTLHSFEGINGLYPVAGLVQATNGDFYGTTSGNNTSNDGTVFEITAGGTLTTLHSFEGINGLYPVAGLVQATNGTLYGTTHWGGSGTTGCSFGCGIVFSEAVGLGPFVETLPTSGKAGADVTILGTNLTGASSVTFNGTAATFTVVSGSEITTSVPAGATTGPVQVVTPGGTLASNVHFRVSP